MQAYVEDSADRVRVGAAEEVEEVVARVVVAGRSGRQC
jgi:hypothetical protein